MRSRAGRLLAGLLLVAATGTVLAGGMAARYGLGWPRRLLWPRPREIILHHSASSATEGGRPVDATLIDRWHERRGWGLQTPTGVVHIGYHYVILPDGEIQPGRPEWMTGAHARGHNNALGICLVGNFSSSANPEGGMKPSEPTPAQLDALHSLLCQLCRRYHLGADAVRRHRDVAQTACPGDRFPYEAVIARLRRSLEGAAARERRAP